VRDGRSRTWSVDPRAVGDGEDPGPQKEGLGIPRRANCGWCPRGPCAGIDSGGPQWIVSSRAPVARSGFLDGTTDEAGAVVEMMPPA